MADDLRDEQRQRMLEMTPDERVKLALRLGEEAIQMYAAANRVDRAIAIQILRRAGNAGRTPSKCNDEA